MPSWLYLQIYLRLLLSFSTAPPMSFLYRILSVPWSPCPLHSLVPSTVSIGGAFETHSSDQVSPAEILPCPPRAGYQAPAPGSVVFSPALSSGSCCAALCSIIRFLGLVWSYTSSSAWKALPPQHVGLPRPSLTTLLSLNRTPITLLSPASAFHSWPLS